MFRSSLITICAFFAIFSSFGQKTMEKEWEAAQFQKVEIISNELSKVKVETWDSEIIKVIINIEGETSESVLLQAIVDDDLLSLKPNYRPYFLKQNDKLAAHKVLSVEMLLYVPPGKDIHIKSAAAAVVMTGKYEKVFVGLEEGGCSLIGFQGNAFVQTKNGDIEVRAIQSKGKAYSKYGKVVNRLPEQGKFTINAESVNGLIRLLKSQE